MFKTIIRIASLFSRAFNVAHNGEPSDTFSERCERDKEIRYFRVWRAIINDVFAFFGDHNHTLRVTVERRMDKISDLESLGFKIQWPM